LKKEFSSLRESIKEMNGEVGGLKSSLSLLQDGQNRLSESLNLSRTSIESPIVPLSVSGADSQAIAGTIAWIRAERDADRLEHLESILHLVQQNLVAAGVRQSDADGVARTITSATLAGQMVQFCGSFADILGVTCAHTFAGREALSWQVPLGLSDGKDTRAVLQLAFERGEDAQALLLRGVNRSAFEVYGTEVRDFIQRRLMTRLGAAPSNESFFDTWADGPATIPGSSALIELGPLLNADELAWSSSSDWGKFRTGSFHISGEIVREMQSASADEVAEVLGLVDSLELPCSRFWRISFYRFVSVLFALPNSTYRDSLSMALQTWVLPWAKVLGVSREKVERSIGESSPEQLQVPSVRGVLDEFVGEVVT
jgi:hypothetical protein